MNKTHKVRVTFTTEGGVTITRDVTAPQSRNRAEALARVKGAIKAYVPAGATVAEVRLP